MEVIYKSLAGLSAIVFSFSVGAGNLKPVKLQAAEPPPLVTAGVLRIESERTYKLSLQKELDILQGVTEMDRNLSLSQQKKMQQILLNQKVKSERIVRAFNKANNALDSQLADIQKLNISNIGAFYDINEDLRNKLNALSFAFESEEDQDGTRIAGLALRQAALAQRMAKIVFLQSLHTSYAAKQGLKVDLAQSRIEFVKGLELLIPEAKDNRMLTDRMQLAKQQWMFYEHALGSPGNMSALTTVSTTSDRIAELMIEVVHIAFGLPTPKTPGARITGHYY